ncbi:kunitz-type serine protease inhibitor A-like [Limulus polyphemus]|uniref:Kunitz-type serine protease inhibitor A-like n=1 Tax=Limulus polyphemus TaxID=6850 RepID=A0ABM1TKN5_LIMPO|nr:kunitz-type serine protease inhibitor A-like [Limulus polyphemus]
MFGKLMLFLLVTSLCSFSIATGQDKDCKSQPDTGPCKAYIPSYYYDPDSCQCKRFIYGGCGGNGNRYKTEADCLAACSGQDKDCISQPDTGPCTAYIPSYYYDPDSYQCKRFIYGGCGGNGNRYNTVADCLAACSGWDCTSPPDPGHCYGYFPRYYYNPKTRQCKTFVYGGCGGNGNQYNTESHCLAACSEGMRLDHLWI